MARDMKSALSKSIANERTAIEDRFSKAESILGGEKKRERRERAPKPQVPKPAPKPVAKKVVRDSFTMPEDDYQLLGELKTQCLKLGIEVNKGEIVRAGLKALAAMEAAQLRQALAAVERIKTGRPKQD